MKENKIYVLATSFDQSITSSTGKISNENWDSLMFVETIKDSTDSAVGGALINWEKQKSLKSVLKKSKQDEQAVYFIGGVGNGVVTKSNGILFPIRIIDQNTQSTSSILRSTDDGLTWNIGGNTEVGIFDGSLVEWNDGKLFFIVSSEKGYRKTYESEDMGTTWKESLMFSRVWGDEPKRVDSGKQGSAIKVSVDGKDVLLFAHPLTEKGGSSADTLQLWLSDGQRIVCVGTISDEEKEHHTGNSILSHVGDHLYITHEINPNGVRDSSANVKEWKGVIGLTSIPEFFENAKITVREWQKIDKWFLSKGVLAKGLVGFLRNTKRDNSVWVDNYKCVDATVRNGKSVIGGFQFNGEPGSGAEWPVASQGQNQVYIFAEKQFTLAATVTIHAIKEKVEYSLLGASLDSQENNVLVGLRFTNDNKWYAVSNNNNKITTTAVFQLEKEYHVALTFGNGVASVYVDDVDITDGKINISGSASINHFYMSGTGQPSSAAAKRSSCIIKNVMLFNRALEKGEIAKLTNVSKEGKLNEPMPITKFKENSGNGIQKPTKEARSDKQEKRPSVGKTGTKDGTVTSLSYLALLCLLCSVVVI